MPHVLSAILFSPRGGSAHAARSLALGLRDQGCVVTLVAGSRGDQGIHGDARAFYGDVRSVDFDAALASETPQRFAGGPGSAPLHPSYEDRDSAPDRVFAALDDDEYELQVDAWARELIRAGAREADVLHLHHLTPINEAAARIAPGVPIVGQLHGTELLMLERIAGSDPPDWPHAAAWARRMRRWAQRCTRLVVAPAAVERAVSLLRVPRERTVTIANGVDLDLFQAAPVDRPAFWRRVLVDEPRGWRPGEPAGSVRYREAEVSALAAGVVLLYVGRFTAVKRLDWLIGAFGRAQRRLPTPASLVLVGGHPGEWEGEHPAQIVARLGVPQVFLAGWHTHVELPEFLSAADAIVLTSEREQFGQVIVEGMACGLPAVATRSLGPAAIISDGQTGWLVAADDPDALVTALTEAAQDRAERERRGELAQIVVRERYSWTSAAEQLARVLRSVATPSAGRASLFPLPTTRAQGRRRQTHSPTGPTADHSSALS
ncbi:MAG: glycosyltransferase family 4 protein [Actinomycetota bacterium]|nr:glycosyltransferase family 4 protein [Actinomycetota bacterium]